MYNQLPGPCQQVPSRPPSLLAETQQARTHKEWVTGGCVVSTPRYTSTTDTGTGLETWHRRCVAMVAQERPQTHHCPCVGDVAPYTPKCTTSRQ